MTRTTEVANRLAQRSLSGARSYPARWLLIRFPVVAVEQSTHEADEAQPHLRLADDQSGLLVAEPTCLQLCLPGLWQRPQVLIGERLSHCLHPLIVLLTLRREVFLTV